MVLSMVLLDWCSLTGLLFAQFSTSPANSRTAELSCTGMLMKDLERGNPAPGHSIPLPSMISSSEANIRFDI